MSSCKIHKWSIVRAPDPYSLDHLQCDNCDSTQYPDYITELETKIQKQESSEDTITSLERSLRMHMNDLMVEERYDAANLVKEGFQSLMDNRHKITQYEKILDVGCMVNYLHTSSVYEFIEAIREYSTNKVKQRNNND